MTKEKAIEIIERYKISDPASLYELDTNLACDMAIRALEEVDRLKTEQPKWISVSERLPKSMANKVLVFLQHEDYVGYIGYGHYEKYKGTEVWYDLEHNSPFSDRGYTVTHWMELPEEPKDGEQE